MIYKTLHRKLKSSNRNLNKTGVNSFSPQGKQFLFHNGSELQKRYQL